MKQYGNEQRIKELSTGSGNSWENFVFYSKQEIQCVLDNSTGIPHWNFGNLVVCEERKCEPLHQMHISSHFQLLDKNLRTVWERRNPTKGDLLNFSVGFQNYVNYSCPNKKYLVSACWTFRYNPVWDATCNSIKNFIH